MTNIYSKALLLIIISIMMHPLTAQAKHRHNNVSIAIGAGNIGYGHQPYWSHVGHHYYRRHHHKRYRPRHNFSFGFRYIQRPRPYFWDDGYYIYPTRRYRVVRPRYYYREVAPRYIRPPHHRRHIKRRAALRPWSPAWYDYCRAKYRSFNAKTGYYTAYSGRKRFCR